jgi:hypothetical protein
MNTLPLSNPESLLLLLRTLNELAVSDRVRRCSSVSDVFRPCSTVYDRVRRCSTVFDRVRPCSTVSDRVRPCPTFSDRVRRCPTVKFHVVHKISKLHAIDISLISIFPGFVKVMHSVFDQIMVL